MIDVHHTILPLTTGPTPDAEALRGHAIACPLNTNRSSIRGQSIDSPRIGGLHILSPTDMVIHCATHLIADGDLAGGLRNLWDFHCLTAEFSEGDDQFWVDLQARAEHHQLWPAVHRAARLAHTLYGTAIPTEYQSWNRQDKWFIRRLTARDGWGRPTRSVIRQIFYIRSHLLRMPPLMLAQHLFTKWRKAKDTT